MNHIVHCVHFTDKSSLQGFKHSETFTVHDYIVHVHVIIVCGRVCMVSLSSYSRYCDAQLKSVCMHSEGYNSCPVFLSLSDTLILANLHPTKGFGAFSLFLSCTRSCWIPNDVVIFLFFFCRLLVTFSYKYMRVEFRRQSIK